MDLILKFIGFLVILLILFKIIPYILIGLMIIFIFLFLLGCFSAVTKILN